MGKRFLVTLLPALHGDCIWIEYGEEGTILSGADRRRSGRRVRRASGRTSSDYLPSSATVELLVVTHIDADHIDGIVKLLRHPELGVKFRRCGSTAGRSSRLCRRLLDDRGRGRRGSRTSFGELPRPLLIEMGWLQRSLSPTGRSAWPMTVHCLASVCKAGWS